MNDPLAVPVGIGKTPGEVCGDGGYKQYTFSVDGLTGVSMDEGWFCRVVCRGQHCGVGWNLENSAFFEEKLTFIFHCSIRYFDLFWDRLRWQNQENDNREIIPFSFCRGCRCLHS